MRNQATLFIIGLMIGASSGWSQVIPFSSGRWNIMAQEHSIEMFKGQECLLMKGGIAILEDIEFLDGIIEFDLAILGLLGVVHDLAPLSARIC